MPLPEAIDPSIELVGLTTNHDRLDGWKAIATYLGRGIRTAQRWERELQLPVHRLERRSGEVVYAFRSEIDAWWKTQDQGLRFVEDRAAPSKTEASHGAGTRFRTAFLPAARWRRPAIWLGPAVLAGLLIMWPVRPMVPSIFRPASVTGPASLPVAPISFSVDGAFLRAQDGFGRVLWSHAFKSSISLATTGAGAGMPEALGIFATLDRQGPSLLFLGPDEASGARKLYRFASSGQRVFATTAPASVTFGGHRRIEGLSADHVIATVDALGTPWIWVAYQDSRRSAGVVQKLDAAGRPQSEYWTSGPVSLLKDAMVGGHHVLLVGATDQGSATATLAVLDYDRSSGSAPSDDPVSRCTSCPPGRPLEVIQFPRLDLARALSWTPRIDAVSVAADGGLTISVLQAEQIIQGVTRLGTVVYMLTPDFKPAGLEFNEDYRVAHSNLRLSGDLDHRFGPGDLSEAFTISMWQGQQFRPLTVQNGGSSMK